MSSIEMDENDADADLIFISEEHIDLEEPTPLQTDDQFKETEKDKFVSSDLHASAEVCELDEAEDVGEQEVEGQDNKLEDKAIGKDGLMVVDEWDDNEMESEPEDDVREKDEEAINPESMEHSLLHMPSLKFVLEDIGHLKENRLLVAHPLTFDEMDHPKLKEIIAHDSCEEVKTHFVRSKVCSKDWTGILVLKFMTHGSAVRAMEEIKQIKEDLTVKLHTNSKSVMEDFVQNSQSEKFWTDNILIVRNLTEDVKLESLKELFPDAEEIVIHKQPSKRRESSLVRGYAFLLYSTDELAKAAAKEYETQKLLLDGQRLYVLPYRLPVGSVPRGLLRLRERKIILRQLDKLTKILEKADKDPSVKIPETAAKRVEKCRTVIEKDDKARKEVNLSVPSYEEMKLMDGLPVVTAADCHRFLLKLGIIEEAKSSADVHSFRRDSRSRSSSRRGNKNSQHSFRRARSPRNKTWLSPRKKNWNQAGGRNQRIGNMFRPDRNSGGMSGNVLNPLALWQQGILGTGGLINPNLLAQPNMGAFLGVQQASLPLLAGLGANLHGQPMDEPKNKVLRLDETGNFCATDSRRFQERDYLRRGEGRTHGRDFRSGDVRRDLQRSRSPDRSGRIGQHGAMRNYSELPGSGMERDSAGSRAGNDSEISNPVNLLLNLSQMLSQKMEQKRQQVERERRNYDHRN